MAKPMNNITDRLLEAVNSVPPVTRKGRVIEATGTLVKAIMPQTRIGELCLLHDRNNSFELKAEVIGFSKEAVLLMPFGNILGISSCTEVTLTGEMHKIAVGPGLLGRVLDGMGNPIDNNGEQLNDANNYYEVDAAPPDPLKRKLISDPLVTGVKVIDGLMTCGEGQRVGIFGAAGVGKSVLLSMLVKNAQADIIVIALIGERGREVGEFIERQLGPENLAKSVVVVSTSDKPAMERLKAAAVATTIAEYFRDQNKKVLLLMDSVTRFARAQREIGLAAGEVPSRRGFPPSVFPALAKLMERTGQSDKGSITAIYTVLVEGDDMTEPVADETRSILDGHIILSRKLAAENHYPAIDVLNSLSRVMSDITTPEQQKAANHLRNLLAKYEEIELLVRVGEYQKGSDPIADEALEKISEIRSLLQQNLDENAAFENTIKQMQALS